MAWRLLTFLLVQAAFAGSLGAMAGFYQRMKEEDALAEKMNAEIEAEEQRRHEERRRGYGW